MFTKEDNHSFLAYCKEKAQIGNHSRREKRRQQFIAKDKAILNREAKAINATVDWFTYRNRFEIAVHAPEGFVWVANGQPTLDCNYERLSPDSAREAVRELLAEMERGFHDSGDAYVPDPEDYEYDEEAPQELDFSL